MKPDILIINDDGIQSPGILALAQAMESLGSITIVAPDQEQSAKSHSITLDDPIRVNPAFLKGGIRGWAVKGTPVDCAKIALRSLLKKKPDLMISGINLGSNLGKNLVYSGTISAAYEGATLGIPSAAISLDSITAKEFSAAKQVSISIATYLLKNKLPKGTMLNVNVPYIRKNKIKGFRVTKQGRSSFMDTFEKRVDPRGRSYFWIKGEIRNLDSSVEFDGEAILSGYVSITPIDFDLTNNVFMNKLKQEFIYD